MTWPNKNNFTMSLVFTYLPIFHLAVNLPISMVGIGDLVLLILASGSKYDFNASMDIKLK